MNQTLIDFFVGGVIGSGIVIAIIRYAVTDLLSFKGHRKAEEQRRLQYEEMQKQTAFLKSISEELTNKG
jgi:hypothetical protein